MIPIIFPNPVPVLFKICKEAFVKGKPFQVAKYENSLVHANITINITMCNALSEDTKRMRHIKHFKICVRSELAINRINFPR